MVIVCNVVDAFISERSKNRHKITSTPKALTLNEENVLRNMALQADQTVGSLSMKQLSQMITKKVEDIIRNYANIIQFRCFLLELRRCRKMQMEFEHFLFHDGQQESSACTREKTLLNLDRSFHDFKMMLSKEKKAALEGFKAHHLGENYEEISLENMMRFHQALQRKPQGLKKIEYDFFDLTNRPKHVKFLHLVRNILFLGLLKSYDTFLLAESRAVHCHSLIQDLMDRLKVAKLIPRVWHVTVTNLSLQEMTCITDAIFKNIKTRYQTFFRHRQIQTMTTELRNEIAENQSRRDEIEREIRNLADQNISLVHMS